MFSLKDSISYFKKIVLVFIVNFVLRQPLTWNAWFCFLAIIEGGFPTHQALQHMAKDLKLSLGMGDSLDHPLPITASVNEVYKHAKRLGYGDHDVSAIYIRTRF